MKKVAVVLFVLFVLMVVAGGIGGGMIVHRGISTRTAPTRTETMLARMMRHYAVPAELRERKNPLPLTPAVLAAAREHFADHCATCHGNNGKGDSALGKQMYPRTPDMTLAATQSLSDGEIFAIIENGVRLTGMPAFGDGTPESAEDTWPLVHFIRHLPKLTQAELDEMEKQNPKTPEEWKQQQAEAAYLKGK